MRRLLAGLTLACACAGTTACQVGPSETTIKPDERLRAMLANGDAKVLSVQELDRKEGEPRRAEMTVQSRKAQSTMVATVDLGSGAVAESRTVPQSRAPFTQEQLEQATAIALRDRAVRQLLGANADSYRAKPPGGTPPFATEGFLVASENPADPCSRSRCIDLLFVANGRYLSGNRVTVDLGTSSVVVRAMPTHGENH